MKEFKHKRPDADEGRSAVGKKKRKPPPQKGTRWMKYVVETRHFPPGGAFTHFAVYGDEDKAFAHFRTTLDQQRSSALAGVPADKMWVVVWGYAPIDRWEASAVDIG